MAVTPSDLARTLVRRAAEQRGVDEAVAEASKLVLAREVPGLRDALGLGRVWLIGSLAWGGFGTRSDIDVVVEHARPDALLAVSERLGEATGRVVDVVSLDTLPPTFRARVVEDGHLVA